MDEDAGGEDRAHKNHPEVRRTVAAPHFPSLALSLALARRHFTSMRGQSATTPGKVST